MVADHLAEAGACCGELVFELGHAAGGAIGLGGLGSDQGFQLSFGTAEFVDPGSEIGGADLVELLAEVEAGIVRTLIALGSRPRILLGHQAADVEELAAWCDKVR
ncbi:hypothetical protein GCM10023347_07850 [Streptomyces chumphonensis]|uniref:Uncharacterized protein n=1 Tax=Streptomyces chumphonensis TaxID=1214925 RepID=A0A927F429_9ACTN|nr:hypothetical protein [Streptomyces chumphonensis]MBD3934826.1 hypothetical protein [Streptomyces chumphonensis]